MQKLATSSLSCCPSISLAVIIVFFSVTIVSGQAFAALNTGDNPPCAKDGACNLAVCDKDPDCPVDLPPGTGAEPATTRTTISLEIINCDDTREVDIRALGPAGGFRGSFADGPSADCARFSTLLQLVLL